MSIKLISTVTAPAAGIASVFFNNIPQTGTDLIIVYSGRTSTTGISLVFRINQESLTGFDSVSMSGAGTLINNGSQTAATSLSMPYSIAPTGSTASNFSNMEIRIHNYTDTGQRAISGTSVYENYSSTGNGLSVFDGNSNSTSPVSSIEIWGYAMVEGSTASLYMVTAGNGGATVTTA